MCTTCLHRKILYITATLLRYMQVNTWLQNKHVGICCLCIHKNLSGQPLYYNATPIGIQASQTYPLYHTFISSGKLLISKFHRSFLTVSQTVPENFSPKSPSKSWGILLFQHMAISVKKTSSAIMVHHKKAQINIYND